MAVESFVNSIIPEDFVYQRKKDELNKKQIELKLSLKEKITQLVPMIKMSKNIPSDYHKLTNKIIELNFLRNEFIHFKYTRDEKNIDPFFIHFEKLINMDLKQNIGHIKCYIKFFEPDFFVEN